MFVIENDIFNFAKNDNVLCITTNGIVKKNGENVMGKGIALDFSKRIPNISKKLGTYLNKYHNRCFNLGKYKIGNDTFSIASFPTKNDWKDKSDINLIKKSAIQISAMADKFGWKHIYIPAPGVGCGGLDWNKEVYPTLKDILNNRFYIMFKK